MNVLAFDTGGEVLSVGLYTDTRRRELLIDSGLRHAESLMPSVNRLMQELSLEPRELDLIACAKGPGSFTGLRIGISTAKGIAEGAECPLVSVSSLDVIAYGKVMPSGAVLPLIDARKGRFYTALFVAGKRESSDLDLCPEELLHYLHEHEYDTKDLLLCGPGAEVFAKRTEIKKNWYIDPLARNSSALALAQCAKELYKAAGEDTLTDGPTYLRKSEAELSLDK